MSSRLLDAVPVVLGEPRLERHAPARPRPSARRSRRVEASSRRGRRTRRGCRLELVVAVVRLVRQAETALGGSDDVLVRIAWRRYPRTGRTGRRRPRAGASARVRTRPALSWIASTRARSSAIGFRPSSLGPRLVHEAGEEVADLPSLGARAAVGLRPPPR